VAERDGQLRQTTRYQAGAPVFSASVRRWPIAFSIAAIVASGCSQNADSPSSTAEATPPIVAAGQTVPNVPAVTDPPLYMSTCTLLRQTQAVTGVHPGSPDQDLRTVIASWEQSSWWTTSDPGRQDTYVRALRDFAAGKC
jgi:hypothetical protein